MSKFGPSRSEIKFRLWMSILGLALLIAAVGYRGMPSGPAMFEVVGIAGAFFGGTFIWSLWKLRHTDEDDTT
jgi:hypothetical protein